MIDKINKSFILLLSQNILLIQIFEFMLTQKQIEALKQDVQRLTNLLNSKQSTKTKIINLKRG